jgi:phenylacetic acid degradation operon negative regulatory protein
MKSRKPKSATYYVLSALIPYTEANLKLTFLPHRFFQDLDRISVHNRTANRTAYYRARQQGLIRIDNQNNVIITSKGKRKLAPYSSDKLVGSNIMVIFDVPEHERIKRNRLRQLLKDLQFKQVQKSVWMTNMDFRDVLTQEIERLDLREYVEVYEARKL